MGQKRSSNMHLAKWNGMTRKTKDRLNSIQTNVKWCTWKEVYIQRKALWPDGHSGMRFWHCNRQFHTNARLTLMRCWGLAALQESLPTRCPAACHGHSNIIAEPQPPAFATSTRSSTCMRTALDLMWSRPPRVCQAYRNTNFGDW